MSEKGLVFLRGFALGHNPTLKNTMLAINIAEDLHEKQTRKSGEPYVTHPMYVALELQALGIDDDIVLAAALLHDVIEDCNTSDIDLIHKYEIDESVAKVVQLLTKTSGVTTEAYYKNIKNDWRASLIKISDRCHNISTMANAFSAEKMEEYIAETTQYVVPLCKYVKRHYPRFSDQTYVMKNHILSVINTLTVVLPLSHMSANKAQDIITLLDSIMSMVSNDEKQKIQIIINNIKQIIKNY